MKRAREDEMGDDAGQCTRVFVQSLAFQTTWQGLKDHFRPCGDIEYASVILGPGGQSKGCGMVDFRTHEEALLAVATMNASVLDGRQIQVKLDVEGKRRQAEMRELREAAAAMVTPVAQVQDEAMFTLPPDQVKRVFVGNLSFSTNWQALKDHFSQVAEVELATVLLKPDRTSKGCGMVNFHTNRDAQRAAEMLNNSELDGRNISVKLDVDGAYKARPPPGQRTQGHQASSMVKMHLPGMTQPAMIQMPAMSPPVMIPNVPPQRHANNLTASQALRTLTEMASLPGARSLDWPALIRQVASQV